MGMGWDGTEVAFRSWDKLALGGRERVRVETRLGKVM